MLIYMPLVYPMLCLVCCNFLIWILKFFGTYVKKICCAQDLDTRLKDQNNKDHSNVMVAYYLAGKQVVVVGSGGHYSLKNKDL